MPIIAVPLLIGNMEVFMQWGATKQGIQELEGKIGYSFQDKALIKQALTHSSYANEMRILKSGNYERMEFLGDAVLEMISSDFLFSKYPVMPEGQLSKLRAALVCEQALSLAAKKITLEKYFLLGKGEESTGGRERDSIACDIMEAVIGAIYKDSGIEEAKKFIFRFILDNIEQKKLFFDAKSTLQELAQSKYKKTLTYKVVYETGPEHDKEFGVEAIMGEELLGRGKGRSKKIAEQHAAYEALLALQCGTE